MKTKRIIIVVVVFVCIFIGIKYYRDQDTQRKLQEIYSLRDDFFDAVIHRDFDKLDRVLTIDTYFVCQRRSFEELRDEIRESFERLDYAAAEEIWYNETMTAYWPNGACIFYSIKVERDCFGRQNSLFGMIRIERMSNGTCEITEIECQSEDYEFGKRLFGEHHAPGD